MICHPTGYDRHNIRRHGTNPDAGTLNGRKKTKGKERRERKQKKEGKKNRKKYIYAKMSFDEILDLTADVF